jgi:hypothetical protein
LGQCDFASIECRVAQHLHWLSLDHDDAESGIGQGPGEAQTRRACPDNDDIDIHSLALGHAWTIHASQGMGRNHDASQADAATS